MHVHPIMPLRAESDILWELRFWCQSSCCEISGKGCKICSVSVTVNL